MWNFCRYVRYPRKCLRAKFWNIDSFAIAPIFSIRKRYGWEYCNAYSEIAENCKAVRRPWRKNFWKYVNNKNSNDIAGTIYPFFSAWEATEKSKRTLKNLTVRLSMEKSRLGVQPNTQRAFVANQVKGGGARNEYKKKG